MSRHCSKSPTCTRTSSRSAAARVIKAVDGVSFTLQEGETLGLVGESGCGKTTTCLSIVGLLPPAARIVGGRIAFLGEDLTQKTPREMRRIRGRMIAMILQDPMASLNPLFSIYRQVAEPAYYHRAMRGRTLRAAGAGAAARGAHPLAGAAHARLSAPDERRHAPAHRRRHRAGRRPEADHRRRTHHQSRCHDPGAVSRPAEGPPAARPGWRSSSSPTTSASSRACATGWR